MQVRTRRSRRGPDTHDVYVDNEFVGIVKPYRNGRGLIAIKKSAEASTVQFDDVETAAKWLAGTR
jgi:hypothetical protein